MPSDEPRRTARRGQERLPVIENKVPSCLPKADSRTIGRGNSSDVLINSGGSVSAIRGSASPHENVAVDAVVENKLGPTIPSALAAKLDGLNRVTRGFRRALKHERDMRHRLADSVQKLEFDRASARADFAVAQLENERVLRSLRGDLATARQEIAQKHGTIVSLNDRLANMDRNSKNLMEIFERGGYLRRSKKPRTERTDEVVPRKM